MNGGDDASLYLPFYFCSLSIADEYPAILFWPEMTHCLVLTQFFSQEASVTVLKWTQEDMSVGHGTLNVCVPFSEIPSERQIQKTISFSTFILPLSQSLLLRLLAARLPDLS